MRKSKIIIATTLILGGIVLGAFALRNVSLTTTKTIAEVKEDDNSLASINVNSFCNNGVKIESNYSIADVSNFEEEYNSSLKNVSKNGSYLTYIDSNNVSSMEAYVEGLGYISGIKESKSSWTFSINDEYFSRIELSSEYCDGFKCSLVNSNVYSKISTWYSDGDLILVPSIDGKNQYSTFKKKELITEEMPVFSDNSSIFVGNFNELDDETCHLCGLKDDETLALSDFANFWHFSNNERSVYMLNGRIAERMLKKLLLEMFSNELNPCENFMQDCVSTEIEALKSSVTSFEEWFYKFDYESAIKNYAKINETEVEDYYKLPYISIIK